MHRICEEHIACAFDADAFLRALHPFLRFLDRSSSADEGYETHETQDRVQAVRRIDLAQFERNTQLLAFRARLLLEKRRPRAVTITDIYADTYSRARRRDSSLPLRWLGDASLYRACLERFRGGTSENHRENTIEELRTELSIGVVNYVMADNPWIIENGKKRVAEIVRRLRFDRSLTDMLKYDELVHWAYETVTEAFLHMLRVTMIHVGI